MRISLVKQFGGFSAACVALLAATADAEPVSFRNDVIAVVSKAGCNLGTCHGNANGKAGFKLSLRGEDPEADFNALTRDLFARRTNPVNPDQSLILVKATTQIAHEGGLRFRKDSYEYKTLREWIAGGLTNDIRTAPRLEALTVSPNDIVVFEPTNEIRLKVQAQFASQNPRDVIGDLPTAEEAKTFVSDKRKDKRERLIDSLLGRPEYADFWALKWADLLRNEEKSLDRKGVQLFHHWIRQSVVENKPLDAFVRELFSARGSTYAQPAGSYFRALRDPVARAESTAQVFLGTR